MGVGITLLSFPLRPGLLQCLTRPYPNIHPAFPFKFPSSCLNPLPSVVLLLFFSGGKRVLSLSRDGLRGGTSGPMATMTALPNQRLSHNESRQALTLVVPVVHTFFFPAKG